MIKAIFFDYDNTLAYAAEIHYLSLNKALEEIGSEYKISQEEHIKTYDGLSTKKKLSLLVKEKNFPQDKVEQVFHKKQVYTIELFKSSLSKDDRLVSVLSELKKKYKLYVVSNAIRETLEIGLKSLGIFDLFEKILSNEDVLLQKPHPQIYLKAMVEACVTPDECLIVEDSKHGRESAYLSKANVCEVDNPSELTLELIENCISKITSKKTPWVAKRTNVLIPMSGNGSRFVNAGFTLPKPLISVLGKPMIQRVVENLNIDANYIFIVQKEHRVKYNLDVLLPLIVPNCSIVETDGLTQGAACSALLAKELIDNNEHLIVANSDQYVFWDSSDFVFSMISKNLDAGILTFKANHPKWSYAKINAEGFVTEVAEKKVISDLATVGIYYFKHGKDFVKYAEQMIDKNIRVNNEFYICPIYNEMISDGKKVKTYDCQEMYGIGTPEDYAVFVDKFKDANLF